MIFLLGNIQDRVSLWFFVVVVFFFASYIICKNSDANSSACNFVVICYLSLEVSRFFFLNSLENLGYLDLFSFILLHIYYTLSI